MQEDPQLGTSRRHFAGNTYGVEHFYMELKDLRGYTKSDFEQPEENTAAYEPNKISKRTKMIFNAMFISAFGFFLILNIALIGVFLKIAFDEPESSYSYIFGCLICFFSVFVEVFILQNLISGQFIKHKSEFSKNVKDMTFLFLLHLMSLICSLFGFVTCEKVYEILMKFMVQVSFPTVTTNTTCLLNETTVGS
ncbi:hypothetical protein EDEG_03561 [Edhazardia aedis USNM 41457]|uniref:Uncharacterized protein n=1 Tax=Edhazardia aedis (strain USNM 41457) TaxID=1003232 RepID=J9D340_EDHAE|nr:hypothetical protein EDEG_03561 [Edhazardia aedis USNM 41457]|eukprot:EJW01989.1 hypothetical protein EDEG_03561 [Edhazardia aedis USNM 41457]